MRLLLVLFSVVFCQVAQAVADGHDDKVFARLGREAWVKESRLVVAACGVTRQGTSIPCLVDRTELADEPSRQHVWLVGGLDGSDRSVDTTVAIMRWFHSAEDSGSLRKSLAVSAILVANPDGWASGSKDPGQNESGGWPSRGFPPSADAYLDQLNPEAQYVWRWLGTQAADLVIEVRSVPGLESAKLLSDRDVPERDSLTAQLPQVAAANMGTIPARQLQIGDAAAAESAIKLVAATLSELLGHSKARQDTNPALGESGLHSKARQERLRRINRSPIDVAVQLGRRYGHGLKTVQYIPALAVIGRLRLSKLTGDASHRAGIDELIAPYRDGRQPAIGDKPSGSDFAGHLLFGELALKTRDATLIKLTRTAADFAFDENGQPRDAMPSHVEMSDAVFMACPLLTQVGRLTGETKYHDMSLRHLAFIRKLCVRPDGLYRNSPLNDAAWGRGNGFPALGLAWALTDLPPEHPGRANMLTAFQQHLAALRPHQDPTGMWHQVIDHPGSYRELTATCMITFAMLRGVQSGWLDRATYEPAIRTAWPAILVRIADDGSLIDVCEGTGKQTSLRAYLDRKAILGPDDRGGAMALLVATEMAKFDTMDRGRAPR